MSETKQTGAVRAARALCDTNENWPKSEAAFNQMVAIIDRETAAPEMLAFVEDQAKSTNCICRIQSKLKGTHLESDLECTKCRAERLIAKAKGVIPVHSHEENEA